MAEQFTPGLMPRTYFRAPRVPFDFRALALAVLGFLVWWSGDLLISKIFEVGSVSGAFLDRLTSLFSGLPFIGHEIRKMIALVFKVNYADTSDYTFWHILVGGAWFLSVWAFFSQGICRITALRIARDEGMSLGEALKFSWKNWPSLLWVPLIVAGAIGIFAALNTLGGLVLSIPFLGQLASIVIIPLAAISTLAILLVALGGIIGMPLISAAAAWECNGSLDAVSRTFSYVFARPLQYFWNFFLIFLFTGVILLIGHWFTYTLVETVDLGVIPDNLQVLTVAPEQSQANENWKDFDAGTQSLVQDLEVATGYDSGGRAPLVQPFARDISVVKHADWSHKLTALMWWVMLNLTWIGFTGFALFYLLGGATSVYADLRADVDGTEEDEIYVENDDADLEALAAEGPASEAPAAPSTPPEPAPDASPDAGDSASDAGGDAKSE